VHTISPAYTTYWPAITHPVVIDGYTQPGSSPNTNGPGQADNAVLTIELTHSPPYDYSDLLEISAGGSTVRGLAIDSFIGTGLDFDTKGGNTISGDFIGTDPTGTTSTTSAYHFYGIQLHGVSNNTIGGTTPDARNIISPTNATASIAIFGTSGAA